MKPGDQIPKKQKPDGESKASAPSKSSAKHCQNCAKWAPAIKNTHNTAQCLKVKADGTRLNGRPNKTVNVHGHDDEILSAFHTMRKEQKALRKQLCSIPLSASSSRLTVLAWTVVTTKC